jgi:hypothetical protein
MIKQLKLILVSSLFVFAMFAGSAFIFTPQTQAQAGLACEGISGGNGSCESDDGPDADSIVKTAINYLSIVAGIIAVIMLIIGGLKFITSGGDASKVSSARSTILYAIIGVVIAVVGQLFVQFVIGFFE